MMAKPSRYKQVEFQAQRAKRQEVKDNPGGENSVPALRARVERLEQALGLKPIP